MSQTFQQEGRRIDCLGSECVCPALNNKPIAGDAVVVGAGLAGVAETTAAATTDTIPINTVGVYTVPVFGQNGGGASAVVKGDKLFIAAATAIVSKIATGIPFGIALDPVGGGLTVSIRVRLGIV